MDMYSYHEGERVVLKGLRPFKLPHYIREVDRIASGELRLPLPLLWYKAFSTYDAYNILVGDYQN